MYTYIHVICRRLAASSPMRELVDIFLGSCKPKPNKHNTKHIHQSTAYTTSNQTPKHKHNTSSTNIHKHKQTNIFLASCSPLRMCLALRYPA